MSNRFVDGAADIVSRILAMADRQRPGRPGPVVPEIPIDPASVAYFRREVFPAAGPVPWLDRPDASTRLEAQVAVGRMSATAAELARSWIRDGFVILPRFFSTDRLDAAWSAYESAIATGIVTPQAEKMSNLDPFPGRILNPHLALPAFNDLLRDPDMLAVIGMLLGAEPLPFQTIIGHKGSQQLPHSDTMHMTTYPLGYLVANWIAFEDIHPNSGPLVYYPGSHRLPYITSVDLDIPVTGQNGAHTDYRAYHARYEPAIANAIAKHGLEPLYFTPRAGDVLLWHANLIHGGSARQTVELSRKALVCHYFAEGCLTYHDYTATASRLQNEKIAHRKSLRRAAVDIALGLAQRSLQSRR